MDPVKRSQATIGRLWLDKTRSQVDQLRKLVEAPFLAFKSKSGTQFQVETVLYFFDEQAFYNLNQTEDLESLNSKLEGPPQKKESIFNLAAVVETSSGLSLFTDSLHSGKFKKKGLLKKFLSSFWLKCVPLLAGSHCIDEHHTDQLILYCCLAQGESRLKTAKLSLHSRAVIELAKIYLKAQVHVKDDQDGTCELTIQGVAFKPNQLTPKNPENID